MSSGIHAVTSHYGLMEFQYPSASDHISSECCVEQQLAHVHRDPRLYWTKPPVGRCDHCIESVIHFRTVDTREPDFKPSAAAFSICLYD